MKSDAMRAKTYRARQSELRESLKAQGLIKVAFFAPAEAADSVAQLVETTADVFLGRDLDLSDDASTFAAETTAIFLKSGAPGNMAVFERDGTRVGIKVIPFRSLPVLTPHPLSTANPSIRLADLEGVFPLLDAAMQLKHYHWRTPEYLSLSTALGLDPHFGEPEFPDSLSELGWGLIEFLSRVQWDFRTAPAVNLIHDVVDLLRTDGRPYAVNPDHVLHEMKQQAATLNEICFPHTDRVMALLEHPEVFGITHTKGGASMACIEFLPSFAGPGYKATISGWYGRHEEDGWVNTGVWLQGVARLPEGSHSTWVQTVVSRLRRQGVVFLDEQAASRYLQGEARYWFWRMTGLTSDISTTETLLWRLSKPATPVSDAAQQRAQAAQLLKIRS